MGLYLALDVGGTKTAAVLGTESTTLARTEAGSIKTLRLSPEEAARNLQMVLQALEQQSGQSIRGQVMRTCIGTSGAAAPGVRAWMERALAEAVGGGLVILGDEVIAIDSAFAGGRGVLVIAGTGSNIVGRASTRAMVHTGGWGPALADEGSGHWIGSEALRACFRAIDRAEPSTADAVSPDGSPRPIAPEHLPSLLGRFLQALALPDLQAIIGEANAPGFAAARLVPAVAEAARAGDLLAGEVLRRAGRDLAGLVAAVIAKMDRLEQKSRQAAEFLSAPPAVAFVGSVLSHVAEVREAMFAGLRERFPSIELHEQATDPLAGALWHARGRPPLLAPGRTIVSDGKE